MSEVKRVNLTTISTMVSTGNLPSFGGNSGGSDGNFLAPAINSGRFGNDMFSETKSDTAASSSAAEERRTTVRLSLDLSPTDKVTYPEINYSRLMRLEEKKRKKLKQKINGASSSSTMPFEENDDDVARIAAELEKKYGCAYGKGRGRSKRDDHCDIGMGYDESDSFIDNTDAYDENIPEEVETVEGGFYINCGALEFKHLNTETTKLKTDEIIKMPNKSRKRILSSSSSDDSSSSENEEGIVNNNGNDKNDQNDSESSASTSKSKGHSANLIKKPKKDKASEKAKKITQQNGKKKEKTNNANVAISASSSNSPKPIAMVIDEVGSDGSDKDRGIVRQKTVKTTTVKDMIKAKRDSFLKMQVGGGEAAKSANGELRGAVSKSSDDESSDSSEGEENDSKSDADSNQSAQISQGKSKSDGKADAISSTLDNTEKLHKTDTKLPELEEDIVSSIRSFKEIFKSKNITGKRFQFDEELTEVFLRIDESLLCIEKSHRNMVFAHLEYHLLLPKYFFLRKAKQLRVKMEKVKTQRALGKLRKAVIEAMPGVIANYEVDVRKHTEMQATNPTGNTIKMPKKKFPWNSNIRNLLYDVYQTRWISFPVLCTRKETLEDFITVYLKEKVVEIWPNGWMRFEELQKEIEKRKQANKKAKEKKENTVSTTSISAVPSTLITTSITTTANIPTTSTTTSLSSYSKQFEEFASSRSCCNSDNDSVGSSSTSNGTNLKRKATADDCNSKNKIKILRNGTIATPIEEVTFSSIAAVTAVSISDCPPAYTPSVQTSTTLSQTTVTTATIMVTNSHSQDNSIHSNSKAPAKQTAHVIDLDEYSSASDILEKSKQLQKASVTMTSAASLDGVGAQTHLAPISQRTSSSDSDGVEIVGVFQANTNPVPPASKVRPKKIQQLQKNIKPSVIFNNNNNKKHSSGLSNAFDVNTALSALKDLERSQHLKPKNSPVNAKESLQ